MFHVEQPENPNENILIWVFLLFFPSLPNENHSHLTFLNFWRGGASSKSTTYLHGPQKRVTNWCKVVIVYILARLRQ